MTLGYMLDSSTCIDIVRGRPVDRRKIDATVDDVHLSTIVLMELLVGSFASRTLSRERLDRLLSRITLLDFDRRAAAHAADIRGVLKARGTPIGPYDAQIAGHARSLGMVLVTSNLREFERVEGLRCEDWRVEA